MIKNALILAIQSFSRKEMTRFREFCDSPYHNKHADVRRLVKRLSRIFPVFTAQNCHREELHKVVFPAQKYDQSRLALVFTYATRQLELFLAQEQLGLDAGYQQVLLLRSLRQRQLFKHYNKIRNRFEKELLKQPHRDSDYYRRQYLAAAEADAFYSQQWQRKKDLGIQQKQLNLDYYYLSEKLRDACEMALRSKILKVQYAPELLEPVIQLYENQYQSAQDIPAIHIYYQIYQLITTQEAERYQAVLAILDQYTPYFPKGELQNIFNYLQNYCIEQVNKGSSDFLAESFQLYQRQLNIHLLQDEKGFLSQWHFKNIVAIGLRLRENGWVHQFIEDYQHQLAPDSHHNAYHFNLAAYYYSLRRFDKVLELLLRIDSNDIRYNLDSKALLLRTYYDLEELEAFLSLTDSFKQYIQRNKLISDFQRRGYANLIKFARKAFKIKSELRLHSATRNRIELSKLSGQLQISDPVYNLSWLERRIAKLQEEVGD